MTKNDFLTNDDTLSFMTWFESIVTGARSIKFPHRGGVDDFLSDAFERYRWPLKRIELATPTGTESIDRNSGFAQNEQLLQKLSNGIKSCLAQNRSTQLNWPVGQERSWCGAVFSNVPVMPCGWEA
ncbi:hypothetical protein ACQ4OD_16900 [Pseudomonas sp. WC1]|uniref:hypothetical protein n=1 Tax=Pseudomonas sp. WC1 TaxID=3424772 RepID=UPI003D34F08E